MRRFLETASLIFSPLVLLASKYPSPPPPGEYVRDDAGVLSPSDIARINALCSEVEEKTTAEMAVLVLSSTGNEVISAYATNLGNYWKVGQASRDNGLVMVVAIDDRQVFTATGSGMEGILPDATVYQIYKQVLVPNFKKAKYGTGIYKALQVYAKEIGKHYSENLESARGAPIVRKGIWAEIPIWAWVFILMVIGFNVLNIVAKAGKKRGATGWFWTTFGSSGSSSGGGFSGGSFGGGGFSGGGGGGGW
ncbi:TPM domain-containing protein [bacterium]|nr:TPM domain-containing protein [bacterium]